MTKAYLNSSLYQRTLKEIKSSVFNCFYFILKQSQPPSSIILFFMLVSWVQFYKHFFDDNVLASWQNTQTSELIQTILNYTTILTHFKQKTFNDFLMIFYVCVAFILLLITMFIIACKATSDQKFLVWPLVILRWSFTLITTILFIPIMEILAAMLACQNSQGEFRHAYYNDNNCWSGNHIAHGLISIVFIIIFVSFSLVIVLLSIEKRWIEHDALCMVDGRKSAQILIFFSFIVLEFQLIRSQEITFVFLLSLLIGHGLILREFYKVIVYFHVETGKLVLSMISIGFFISIMELSAFFLEEKVLDNLVYYCLCNIPLVSVYICTRSPVDMKLVYNHPNQIPTVNDVIQYAQFVNFFNRNQKTIALKYSMNMLLAVHGRVCKRADCFVQVVQRMSPAGLTKINLVMHVRGLEIQEYDYFNELRIYWLTVQIYDFQCKKGSLMNYLFEKFKESVELRLNYGLTLAEDSLMKQQAMQELALCSQFESSFDTSFLVYQYKRILDEEISENRKDDLLDVISEIAYINNIRNFQTLLDKSASFHVELWAQMMEDIPDLQKIHDLGTKLNQSFQNIEDLWKMISRMNGSVNSTSRVMNLYGRFLKEIKNDDSQGDELLIKSRQILTISTNKSSNIFTSLDEISQQSLGTIILSSQAERIGQIVAINSSACRIFGYPRLEIIGRKIEVLMPSLLAELHDSFLNNFLSTKESEYMKRQRPVLARNKSQYLFPSYIRIRTMQTTSQNGLQFIGSFRLEKMFRQICYILTDTEGIIVNASASCISLFYFDNQWYSNQQKPRHINKLVPEVFDVRQNFMKNIGDSVNVTIPQNGFDSSDSDDMPVPQEVSAYLIVSEFLPLGQHHLGWFFRFEIDPFSYKFKNGILNEDHRDGDVREKQFSFSKQHPENQPLNTPSQLLSIISNSESQNRGIPQSNHSHNNGNGILHQQQKQAMKNQSGQQVPTMIFCHQIQQSMIEYYGKVHMEQFQEITSVNNQEQSRVIFDEGLTKKASQQEDDLHKNELLSEKQYSKDIKTFVLGKDGQIGEKPDEQPDDEIQSEEIDEDQQRALDRELEQNLIENNDDSIDDIQGTGSKISNIQSERVRSAFYKSRSELGVITQTKTTMNLFILILIVLAALSYGLNITSSNSSDDQMKNLFYSNQRFAEQQQILGNFIDFLFLNKGIYPAQYYSMSTEQRDNKLADYQINAKQQILRATSRLQELSQNLSFYQDFKQIEQQQLYTSDIIPILFQDMKQTQFFTLTQIIRQFVGFSNEIKNQNIFSNFSLENPNVYFIIQNSFQSLTEALQKSSTIYLLEYDVLYDQQKDLSILMVALPCSLIGLQFIIFTLQIYCISFRINEILLLLLDIPKRTIQVLSLKCQNFTRSLQEGQDNDNGEAKDNMKFSNEDWGGFDKRKRKKYKHNGAGHKGIFIWFTLFSLTQIGYFIYVFILQVKIYLDATDLTSQLDVISQAQPTFLLNSNIVRYSIFNSTSTFSPFSKPFTNDYSLQLLEELYQIIREIHQDSIDHYNIHQQEYNNYFYELEMGNSCLLKDVFTFTDPDCTQFDDKALTQGLSRAFANYLEYFKRIHQFRQAFAQVTDKKFYQIVPKTYSLLKQLQQDLKEYYTLIPRDGEGLDGEVQVGKGLDGEASDQEQLLSLVISPDSQQMRTYQKLFFKHSLRKLSESIMQEFKYKMNDTQSTYLIFFVLYYCVIGFSYIFFWLPAINRQSDDFLQTRRLINVIPIKIINRVKNLKQYVYNYIQAHEVLDY